MASEGTVTILDSDEEGDGIQHWTVVSSCILPCTKSEYDQQAEIENDTLPIPSAKSGPQTHLDTPVPVGPPLPSASNIIGQLSSQDERVAMMSGLLLPPIVIQPEQSDAIKPELYQTSQEASGQYGSTESFKYSKLNRRANKAPLNNRRSVSKKQPVDRKPFKCIVCARGFRYPSELTKHAAQGTVCGDGWSPLEVLQRQQQSYTKEKKPHQCTDCGKVFNKSSTLTRHQLLTHAGHKPYKCEVCGRGFAQPYGVAAHMRTHTGEKPYVCPVCGKGFTQSGTMTRHRLNLHPAE